MIKFRLKFWILQLLIIFNNFIKSILSPVKQHIGSRASHTAFAAWTDRTVVILMPFTAIFSVSRVVTSSQTSIMIADSVKFVKRLAAIRQFIFAFVFGRNNMLFDLRIAWVVTNGTRVDYIGFHVQQWREVDLSFVLLFPD